jgi:predicted dehydrogenase
VKWGVLGAAKIAANSRDAQKGHEAGRKLGIAKVHDSYEALLADPELEAIYNPLPNHLHCAVVH